MAETDPVLEQRLLALDRRLAHIEEKLNSTFVYDDVYQAEKTAFRESLAATSAHFGLQFEQTDRLVGRLEHTVREEAAEVDRKIEAALRPVGKDVDELKSWRTSVYLMIGGAYFALLAMIVIFLLNRSAGG